MNTLGSEHIGHFIGELYYQYGYPRMGFPPDEVSKVDVLDIEQYDITGARLSRVHSRYTSKVFMRLFDLASGIGAGERLLLGQPTDFEYKDLVLECPDQSTQHSFKIVQDETKDTLDLLATTRMRRKKSEPSQFAGSNYVKIFHDPRFPAIYMSEGPIIRNIQDQLPQTAAACLSVAGLIIENELPRLTGGNRGES